MVLLSLDEHEDLIDTRGHAAGRQAIASGAMETLSEAETAAFLAAKTPMALWRRHRDLTQLTLAEAVGVSQAYIAQIENGVREGSPVMLRDIARVLQVGMEDLVAWNSSHCSHCDVQFL
jgi:DNA-binding XRE family transcriptional regulator